MMLRCLWASGSRYRCSGDAELRAESSPAAPFGWGEFSVPGLSWWPQTLLWGQAALPFSQNKTDFMPPVSLL